MPGDASLSQRCVCMTAPLAPSCHAQCDVGMWSPVADWASWPNPPEPVPVSPSPSSSSPTQIADFGLARSLEMGAGVMTKNYGTLTHMPPETLTRGVVSAGTDVSSGGRAAVKGTAVKGTASVISNRQDFCPSIPPTYKQMILPWVYLVGLSISQQI